jgi:hypothetical protein
MAKLKEIYLNGPGGVPVVSRSIDNHPQRIRKTNGGRQKNEKPIKPNSVYDRKVKEEHEDEAKKKLILDCIKNKNWETLDLLLNDLLKFKRKLIRPIFSFTRENLNGVRAPSIKKTLKKCPE